MGRLRAALKVVVLLAAEVGFLVALYKLGPALGTVPFGHLSPWLRQPVTQTTLTAVGRLVGLAVGWWLLVATVVSIAAGVTSMRQGSRGWRLITLPLVRKLVEGAVGVSMLVSTVTAAGVGGASAATLRPAAVVQLAPGHLRGGSSATVTTATGAAVQGVPASSATGTTPTTAVTSITAATPSMAAGPTTSAAGTATPQQVHLPHPGQLDETPPAVTFFDNPAAPGPDNGFVGLAAGTPVYVVQKGDCLSVIADRLLKDWRLDDRIFDLNKGLPQRIGVVLTEERWIYPGQVLVLPPEAAGAPGVIVVGAPPGRVAPAAGGQQAGDAGQQPVGPAALPPPAAPPVPSVAPAAVPAATAAPSANRAASANPATASGSASVFGAGSAVAAATSPAVSPATGPVIPPSVHNRVGGVAPVAGAAAQNGGGTSPGVGDGGPKVTSRSSGGVIGLPIGDLAAGGLATGGFLYLLTRLRRSQQARRRLGERAPRPTGEEARVELAARVVADDALAEFVDLGSRLLTVGLADADFAVPTMLGVEVHPDCLVVVLDGAAAGVPEGFEAGDDPATWVLWYPDDDAALEQLRRHVYDVVPALPSLVAVGRDGEVTVLLHLEAVGVISIGGDDGLAGEVLAAAAMELASSTWSHLAHVVLVGIGHAEGLGLVGEPSVVLVDELDDCLGALAAEAASVREAAAECGARSLAELRIGEGYGDVGPTVVLCAAAPGVEQLERLVELAADPACGLCGVVAVTGCGVDLFDGRAGLEIRPDGLMTVGPLERTVEPQRLALPVLDTMEGALAVAAAPASSPRTRTGDGEADEESDWFVVSGGDELVDDAGEEPAISDAADIDDDEEAAGEAAVLDDDEFDEFAEEADEAEADADADEVVCGEQLNESALEDEASATLFPGSARSETSVEAAAAVLDELDELDDDEIAVGGSLRRLSVVQPRTRIENVVRGIIAEWPEVALGPGGVEPDLVVDTLGAEPVIVRLLDPGAGPIRLARRASLEALVYIALHDEPVFAEKVAIAVYPEQAGQGRLNTQSFRTTMTTARTALGLDRDGNDLLARKSRAGKFSTTSRVLTTWKLFQRLLDAALAGDGPEVPCETQIRYLAAALTLLGDVPPFDRIFGPKDATSLTKKRSPAVKHWGWLEAEQYRTAMAEAVVDAAGVLSSLLLAAGDHRGARNAIRKGVLVTPLNADLWAHLMNVEADRGNAMGIQIIWDEYERRHEDEVEPYGGDNSNYYQLRDHYTQLLRTRRSG